MVKQILNISKCAIFICFSFFFQSKKIYYFFNCSEIQFFFSLKRFIISSIEFYSSGLGFSINICYEKKINFKKLRSITLLKKAFENIIFKTIQVIFKLYYHFMNQVKLKDIKIFLKKKKKKTGYEHHKNLLEDEKEKLIGNRKRHRMRKKSS